ncbi:MAG: 2-amino-4-hydroxy-6-hydroxymethyldihydropteridine diphosphokinase [Candidatus Latescibacterota bacterium]
MLDERSNDIRKRHGLLSVGSNIGEREANVLKAVRLIGDTDGLRAGRCSSLYETAPVEGVAGGYFMNAILQVQSLLCPTDLLLRLKALEKHLGRSRGHLAAREVDIDIITLGEEIIQSPSLTIPHARYRERAFVLVPLREILPDFRCPESGRHIAEMIARLPRPHGVFAASSRGSVYV